MCWYKRQYGKENRVNFEQKNGMSICHSCNTEAEPCPAVKVWEVSEDKQLLWTEQLIHPIRSGSELPTTRLFFSFEFQQ